jgi:hypothetical protein
MRKFAIGAMLLVLAAVMALGQSSQQSSDQQSTTDQMKGAASSAGSAVKSGAETGYNKTKEGTEKAYGATKNAVTGSSSDQQNQSGNQGTSNTSGGKLPQSASPLPLLGLLGLGTFSLGVWKARWFRK